MKKYDTYCGLFWLVMALFVSVTSLVKFGLGTFRYPGPGFFPFLVGLVLLFLSIGMIGTAMKERAKSLNFKEWPSFHKNVSATLWSSLPMPLLWNPWDMFWDHSCCSSIFSNFLPVNDGGFRSCFQFLLYRSPIISSVSY